MYAAFPLPLALTAEERFHRVPYLVVGDRRDVSGPSGTEVVLEMDVVLLPGCFVDVEVRYIELMVP